MSVKGLAYERPFLMHLLLQYICASTNSIDIVSRATEEGMADILFIESFFHVCLL